MTQFKHLKIGEKFAAKLGTTSAVELWEKKSLSSAFNLDSDDLSHLRGPLYVEKFKKAHRVFPLS